MKKKYSIYFNRNRSAWDWRRSDDDLVFGNRVATVECDGGLEEVFYLTNNRENGWEQNDGVSLVGLRSLSVGDVVKDEETGKVFVVKDFGFDGISDKFLGDSEYEYHRCYICGNRAQIKMVILDDGQGYPAMCTACYKPFEAGLNAGHVTVHEKIYYR